MVFVSRRSAMREQSRGPAAATYEGLRTVGRTLGEASAPMTIVEPALCAEEQGRFWPYQTIWIARR